MTKCPRCFSSLTTDDAVAWVDRDPAEVTVISIDTQTVLSTHTIDPNRGYWRNKKREPGRWPGSRS